MSDAEKTLPATPRRREEARKQGNVWQPRELGPAVAVGVAALAAMMMGPGLWGALGGYLSAALAVPMEGLPVTEMAGMVPARWPLGLAAAVMLASGGLSVAAVRHVTMDSLAPKWSRVSPVKGLQRIFSMSGLMGGGTALMKLAAVAGVAMVVVVPMVRELAHVEDVGGIGGAVVRVLAASALMLLLVAVVDGAISWMLREKKLMMSLDEVKRESRQNDGAPEVKAAIRRAQFAASKRRLQTSLAEASVVVVNPVHFAVALRYRPGIDAAPVVIEKGRLETALAIIAVAGEMAIPVVRTPRLARALFFTAKIGQPVREELFNAVATILAFVMRVDAETVARAAPGVFVPPAFDFDEHGERRKAGAA
ncbi:flagellar biosynthesis protein FlhB [Polymorphobacter glacialis]|uniref:Flagellar biosynthesis protein FlhB n=1 Tax=Sandarakinorhabdus glacialis TaxID=1614636 RepID=A0A917ECJ8_9SPHN|nr:EscU/YscU/HrcU family type III secretion system export apparatus switch protein [Polymorphobacter glacialis]GGE20842.1 flagellar biosynthesis protein FlhB [Polymorphobacter glacialis]